MDCSAAESGWFELKAFITDSSGSGWWEGSISQSSPCASSDGCGGSPPYSSGNHFARCGFVNVFEFQQSSCIVNSIGHVFASPSSFGIN